MPSQAAAAIFALSCATAHALALAPAHSPAARRSAARRGAAPRCTANAWDVVLHRDGATSTLTVPEGVAVLSAAEAAGLLPGSDCRRGRCFSCAARVRSGAPFSLSVMPDSALCEEAHLEGVVLLCSAYVCGPGVELELDYEAAALDIQHRQRWQRNSAPPTPLEQRPPTPHFRMPDDVRPFLERCALDDGADAACE